jgi:mannose-1-phosphate guanylyltransferase
MRHAVILAGGRGERFWPVSREDRPKQFLPLAGGRTLLRATFERLQPLFPLERIWVVTSAGHSRLVARELPELEREHILKEPRGRNTAPALALAALAIAPRDARARFVAVPADAWIPEARPYRSALARALRVAETEDRLVLVGVRARRPETGYGYIRPGRLLPGGEAREVLSFVEKPSRARAARLVADRRTLWNCGIFAGNVRVFQEAVREHLPRLARAFRELERGRWGGSGLARAYERAPSVSVDAGVLEPADNLAVVPADFPWDDLGSWAALGRLGNGSFRRGDVDAVGSPGLIAWAEQGTVAVIGVSDVVVVHTPEATLVAAKDRVQEVRRIAARRGRVRIDAPRNMQSASRNRSRRSRRVEKP